MWVDNLPDFLSTKFRIFATSPIDLLKKIKFLLKDRGLTINGAKKVLNSSNSNALDEISNKTIRTDNVKSRLNKISNLIKEIKNNG